VRLEKFPKSNSSIDLYLMMLSLLSSANAIGESSAMDTLDVVPSDSFPSVRYKPPRGGGA
jgi:hypothetical protein